MNSKENENSLQEKNEKRYDFTLFDKRLWFFLVDILTFSVLKYLNRK